MLEFQNQTRKEIWQAKKLIYESDEHTKKSFVLTLGTLVLLTILLLFSLAGQDDSWTCEIESSNNRGKHICTEMRRTINCKTVTGPIRSEIFVKVKQDLKASAIIECPWEIAISEIRLCFILLSFISVLAGFYAIKKSNRKYAEISFQSGIAFAVLLIISSYFDYISIQASKINNYNMCNLQEEFSFEGNISGQMDCQYSLFNLTVYVEIFAAIVMIINSLHLNQWRLKQLIEHVDQI